MRPALVPASTLTDVRGNNKKARPLSAWLRQAIRAVVRFSKPTGGSASNTPADLTSTRPGKRTRQSWQASLSLRPPGKARHGVGNEYHVPRNASPNHLCSD